jgi:hypothetical protein
MSKQLTKLRDKLAEGAMQSLLGAYGGDISPEQVAIVSYMVADEMLKVRLKPVSFTIPVPAPEPAPAPSPARPPLIEPRHEQGPHPDDVGFLAFSPAALDGLTPRVTGSLDRNGVRTIGALTRLTPADLTRRRFGGIGPTSIARIREALAIHGLHLAGEADQRRKDEPAEGAKA